MATLGIHGWLYQRVFFKLSYAHVLDFESEEEVAEGRLEKRFEDHTITNGAF